MTDNDLHTPSDNATATPPPGFDPFAAGMKELVRYGLPPRPDPRTHPGQAALWERKATRWSAFDHLPAQTPRAETAAPDAEPRALGLAPIESCGFTLNSFAAPFTALFATWTVPNLRHNATQGGTPNEFRTFVGLGFLDVHVEMTVDSAHNVTAAVTAQGANSVDLPVAPGDVLSAAMCLNTKPPGRANYVLANETRSETVNFSFDSNFPPAVTINAGISRDVSSGPRPLAHFGAVYFDEISAFSMAGSQSLPNGEAVTMVDLDGSTLAKPSRLTDFTFRVFESD